MTLPQSDPPQGDASQAGAPRHDVPQAGAPHDAGHGDAVVSSDAEELILVDFADAEVGYATKADAHDGHGMLHRAFSLFLVDDDGRVLLQRRAESKRLWPGYWANSVCSHPRRGETMEVATARRLAQELGVSAELEFVYKFDYFAQFGALGSERELCWVYVGRLGADSGSLAPNRTEIAETRWLAPGELDAEMTADPDAFTPWLRLEWAELRGRGVL